MVESKFIYYKIISNEYKYGFHLSISDFVKLRVKFPHPQKYSILLHFILEMSTVFAMNPGL